MQYLGAMWCSTNALHSISYVSQVLCKSGKAIPIMLIGLAHGKRYKLGQWMGVAYVVCGVCWFALLTKSKASPHSMLSGYVLVLISLCLDGVTGALEDRMVDHAPSGRKPSFLDFMFNINLWALPMSLALVLVSSDWMLLASLFSNTRNLALVAAWGLCGAAGQCCIFFLIAHDGAMLCSVATTLRKFVTVLLSILWFGHAVSLGQMLAIACTFGGVALLMHQKRNSDIPSRAVISGFVALLALTAVMATAYSTGMPGMPGMPAMPPVRVGEGSAGGDRAPHLRHQPQVAEYGQADEVVDLAAQVQQRAERQVQYALMKQRLGHASAQTRSEWLAHAPPALPVMGLLPGGQVAEDDVRRWHTAVDLFLYALDPRLPSPANPQYPRAELQQFVSRLTSRLPAALAQRQRRCVVKQGEGTGWLLSAAAQLAGGRPVQAVAWWGEDVEEAAGAMVFWDDGPTLPRLTELRASAQQAGRPATSHPVGDSSFIKRLALKDGLQRTIRRAQRLHSQSLYDVLPPSFALPEEREQLRQTLAAEPEDAVWVVKPTKGFAARGIYLMRRNGPLPPEDGSFLVQRYVPPLLLGGHKFDMRLHALLLFRPLRLYLHRDAIVRLASEPFRMDADLAANKCMHITNQAFQGPNCPNYVKNQHAVADPRSHLWSGRQLRGYLERQLRRNPEHWWRVVQNLVVASTLAASEFMAEGTQHDFQFFGPDVAVDRELRPWLLEMNAYPTTSTCCPLDTHLKARMLTEMWRLVGAAEPPRAAHANRTQAQLERFCERRQEGCSAAERELLLRMEDEAGVAHEFELVFPRPGEQSVFAHLPLAKAPDNELFQSWLDFVCQTEDSARCRSLPTAVRA